VKSRACAAGDVQCGLPKVIAQVREDYAQETRLGAVPAVCIPSRLALLKGYCNMREIMKLESPILESGK
jgi:hypothetical protein